MTTHGTQVHLRDIPLTVADVLIIGAGPTGLMAALVLAKQGVSVIIVDRKSGPTQESRALAVQARSMEIYEQLGLVEDVLVHAYPARAVKIGSSPKAKGPDFSRMTRGASLYSGIHIFEQSRNEELLGSALLREGRKVWWNHRVLEVHSTTLPEDEGVEALMISEQEGTLQRVQARWCIAADGASSLVRRELTIPFEGSTDGATFWVADLRDVVGAPSGVINVRVTAKLFAILFPLGPGGHTRCVALAAQTDIDEADALASLRADFGLDHGRVEWFSRYKVHHRVASFFHQGPFFLAGDAAHVHSPLGGQGMNTGLQDAHNLALLLADVVHGRLHEGAVQRYEVERRPVALKLVNVTDRIFGVVARHAFSARVIRRFLAGPWTAVFPLVSRSPAGARIGGLLGQYRIRYHYRGRKKSQQPSWANDSWVGVRLPPVADNHHELRTLSWQLHTYGDVPMDRSDFPASLPPWVSGPNHWEGDPRGRLRADRVYLIRPDGFIAASLQRSGKKLAEKEWDEVTRAHYWVTDIDG